MELIPTHKHAGELAVPSQPSLEEMRENLLLGIKTLIKQSSGIKDPAEYELLYGRAERELKLVLDHIILLAKQQEK